MPEPLQHPRLDAALEIAEADAMHQGEGIPGTQTQDADAAMSEGDVIVSLDQVDESDEDALLSIARRLKRVRRS